MGESMTKQRSYYTIMPSRILSDTRLTATARVVYGVIENLARRTGECYASNDYIITSMGDYITDRTLRRAMECLEDCGYIEREIRMSKGTQNERIIKISNNWKSAELSQGGADKNDRTVRTKMSGSYNDEKQSVKIFSLARVRADEMFQKIWMAYSANRRGSEKKAYDAYIQAITIHQVDPQAILDAIPQYLNSAEVQDQKKKQYLSNWLENGGYNTEYAPAKPKPTPHVKPPRPECPAITNKGRSIWITTEFQTQNKIRNFDTIFDRFIKDWCDKNQVCPEIIKQTAEWLNWDKYYKDADDLALKWFVLGSMPNLDELYDAVAFEWWGWALVPIERKECTHGDKQAEWAQLCRTMGYGIKWANYDPTESWAKKREFYQKMGWTI